MACNVRSHTKSRHSNMQNTMWHRTTNMTRGWEDMGARGEYFLRTVLSWTVWSVQLLLQRSVLAVPSCTSARTEQGPWWCFAEMTWQLQREEGGRGRREGQVTWVWSRKSPNRKLGVCWRLEAQSHQSRSFLSADLHSIPTSVQSHLWLINILPQTNFLLAYADNLDRLLLPATNCPFPPQCN